MDFREIIGTSESELSQALELMESELQDGQSARITLCTEYLPTPDELDYIYSNMIAAGNHVSFPVADIVQGIPTTQFVVTKGSPLLPLLVPLLIPVLTLGLITFGVAKIESISSALMPILLVVAGTALVLAVISRGPATKYIERGGKIPYLPSTVPATTEYVTIMTPGATDMKPYEVISYETFKKENDRVRKLGLRPATGQIKRGNKWEWVTDTLPDKDSIEGDFPKREGFPNPFDFHANKAWREGGYYYAEMPDLAGVLDFANAVERADGYVYEINELTVKYSDMILLSRSKFIEREVNSAIQVARIDKSPLSLSAIEDIRGVSGALYDNLLEKERVAIDPMIDDLEKSIKEEEKAKHDYSVRSTRAYHSGDRDTAYLYDEIARDEAHHANQLRERLGKINQEEHLLPDSKEYLAYTIDDIGYREPLDRAFSQAIARSRGK